MCEECVKKFGGMPSWWPDDFIIFEQMVAEEHQSKEPHQPTTALTTCKP
jgi:hypothetical protein